MNVSASVGTKVAAFQRRSEMVTFNVGDSFFYPSRKENVTVLSIEKELGKTVYYVEADSGIMFYVRPEENGRAVFFPTEV